MKEWYSENGLKMNSNKTKCILFANPYFNQRTETFQITIDDTVRQIIIIIKKGRHCKAEREWYTPYQSKDPSPQYQPIDRKKRKGKKVEDYSRDRAA